MSMCAAADLPPVARVGVTVTEKKLTLDTDMKRTNLNKADQAIRAADGD